MKRNAGTVDLQASNLAAKQRWEAIKASANANQLPPHSDENERGALSCVLQAGDDKAQQEVDALLEQLRPNLFYDLRHKAIFLVQLPEDGVVRTIKRSRRLTRC